MTVAVTAVEQFAEIVRDVGYRDEALVRDYPFADVMVAGGATRTAPLVAFTRTPPSYRSAALAVVEGAGRRAIDLVLEYRALGAPLLFVIELDDVTVWQVRSSGPPRALEKVKFKDLRALFERNREAWHPDAIHRAKAVGNLGGAYQLDFVDVGLLPAIEGEVHLKLDRLLLETLDIARRATPDGVLDARTLFRVVFRLLAAKVLQDRRHPYAEAWDQDNLVSVLDAIAAYYNLGKISDQASTNLALQFDGAWKHLLSGISFSNISSDDLAFVYENTLVTPETRKLFGTHSTPRQVAEYVVQRLELHRHDPAELRIYEPFAGAGVFLVSALRHLRDLLPEEWTDQQRHDFLIGHISGDEVDAFACEVATLSLILADYPNHNGWHVREADLFKDGVLASRMAANNVVVCNPPFEAFSKAERANYALARKTHSKAIAALNAALDVKPLAIGFVLPRSFILDQQFAEPRRRLEQLYGYVEVLKLPDGIFGASQVESAAVIARDLRPAGEQMITLRSTEVSERDRAEFLKTGYATATRSSVRAVADDAEGQLWLPPLREVWEYLRNNPTFSSLFETRRGLEWHYQQALAVHEQPGKDDRLGYANAQHMRQYQAPRKVWLDFRKDQLRCGAGHDWSNRKLIASATRLSRGPWCVGAFADLEGLLCSQQFFALRPLQPMSEPALMALTGVLNGPVANAFLAIHSPKDRFRTAVVDGIPAPHSVSGKLAELVEAYVSALPEAAILQSGEELLRLLAEIDAAVLEAYDLPLRLERQVTAFFQDAERPTLQPWKHWDHAYPSAGLTLAERVSGRFRPAGAWVGEVFQPLPAPEAAVLRDYMA